MRQHKRPRRELPPTLSHGTHQIHRPGRHVSAPPSTTLERPTKRPRRHSFANVDATLKEISSPGPELSAAPASHKPSILERVPFPQELIELVIDNIYDVATLESCTLVSRSFSPRSKKYLFEHIDLINEYPDNPENYGSSKNFALCERFLSLLTNSPHIIPLIKSLRIRFFAYKTERRFWEKDLIMTPSFQEGAEQFLPDALNLLTGLRSLSIGGFDERRVLHWYRLKANLRLAFMNVFNSPILQRAEFDNVTCLPFFAMFMNMFNPALKHLAMGWCGFSRYWCEGRAIDVEEYNPNPPVPNRPRMCLESLRLIASQGHGAWAVDYLSLPDNRFDFGHIRTFTSSLEQQTGGNVKKLLEATCGESGVSSLEHIYIEHPDFGAPIYGWGEGHEYDHWVVDLSQHPSLLSLGFLFDTRYDPAPWIFQVLGTVPLGCPLGVITLTIRRDACENVEQIFTDEALLRMRQRQDACKKVESAWSRIDRLLTDEARPVCPRLVIKVKAPTETSLHQPGPMKKSYSDIEAAYRKVMPGLDTLGLLVIEATESITSTTPL